MLLKFRVFRVKAMCHLNQLGGRKQRFQMVKPLVLEIRQKPPIFFALRISIDKLLNALVTILMQRSVSINGKKRTERVVRISSMLPVSED